MPTYSVDLDHKISGFCSSRGHGDSVEAHLRVMHEYNRTHTELSAPFVYSNKINEVSAVNDESRGIVAHS